MFKMLFYIIYIQTNSFQRLKLELDSKTKELSETNGRIEKRDEKIVLNFHYF